MVLSEFEKNFIVEQMLKALKETDLTSVYSISRNESQKKKIYNKDFYSNQENRKRKQATDRQYDRWRNNSSIHPESPSTRFFKHRSDFEIDNRQKIQEALYCNVPWKFNEFPLFLYNPLTHGRFEADAISVEYHLIIETHEKGSHSSKSAQIRDLQKKTIIEHYGWDLIVITENQIGHVEEYLQTEWEKILEKRLNGFLILIYHLSYFSSKKNKKCHKN